MNYLLTGDRARWEVMWLVRKKGKAPRIVSKDFQNDLSGALELYLKAKAAGKHMVTLRCKNCGFPPPEKYRPHLAEEKKTVGYKTVKKQGKAKKIRIVRTSVVEVVPMQELNLKGIWWCPYCREMRKFKHYAGLDTDRMNPLRVKGRAFVPAPGLYCPMCWINQNDSHVRRWNPQAALMEFRENASRRTRSSGRHRTSGRSSRRRS